LKINLVSIPPSPGTITGNNSPCENAIGEVYSISAVTGATTYNWGVPAGASITNGQGTTSITVTFGTTSGVVNVSAGNACGNSQSRFISITLNSIPSTPGTITGTQNPCQYETGVPYSINAVTGATSYNWTVPSGATVASGQGTTAITVDFGDSDGNIGVRAENVCGNSNYQELKINLVSIPPSPGAITGSTSPCENATGEVYSINAVSGATTYDWGVPADATITNGQGSTIITVTFGTTSGNVNVRAGNTCGYSQSRFINITLNSIPSSPGAITGSTSVCVEEQGVTYSISSVSGATSYNWIVPLGATIASGQGTTSITVNFGSASGIVRVRAQNTCGNSSYRIKMVSTSLTDSRDSKSYNTQQIGTQCWMAENLNYNSTTSWCYFNQTSNCDKYGRLYQWSTAQTVCPTGWHLPSTSEWSTLTTYLNGTAVAGGKMKETGTAHWMSPNTGATNLSGFTGLGGGRRTTSSTYQNLRYYGYFWTTGQFGLNGLYRQLSYNNTQVMSSSINKNYGISVRCIRD
jgi:uncharacterized protein (TIGR02145 family)